MDEQQNNQCVDKKQRRTHATKEDVDYIKKYASCKTDSELAETLGGSVPWIRKIRSQFGIKKNATALDREKGLTTDDVKDINKRKLSGDISVINEFDVEHLKDDKIESIFKDLFKNTMHYSILSGFLDENELKYYLEEFSMHIAEIRKMGETITPTEMRSLDSLIISRIRMNRMLGQEKDCQKEIKNIEISMQTCSQEELLHNQIKISELRKTCDNFTRAMNELNKQISDLLKTLDVTRQERLKRMSDSDAGVLQIVKTMQDKTKRQRLELQAAMVKKSSENLEKSWKSMGYIMDSNTFAEETKKALNNERP